MRDEPTKFEPYRDELYHGITILAPLTAHVTRTPPVGCPADRTGIKKGPSRVTGARLSGVRSYVARGTAIEYAAGSYSVVESVVVIGIAAAITVIASTHRPSVVCRAPVSGEVGNPFVVTKAMVEHPFKKDCVHVILTPNVGVLTGVPTVLPITLASVKPRGRETVPTATGVSGPTRTGPRAPTHIFFVKSKYANKVEPEHTE